MSEIQPIGPYSINSMPMALPSRVGVKGEPAPIVIPAGMQIRRKVAQEFGIEILDSDVKFAGAECAVIADVLKEIKKRKQQHLIGVRQIVKNREYRVRLLNSAMVHAGGAYDSEKKRVYIFDEVPLEGIPEVLIHEVGHAVSHFNLEFTQFMDFVKTSGYNMVEFRKYFINDNRYHQIGTKKIDIPDEKWTAVYERFSMQSLSKSEDVFGEIVLEAGRKKRFPWDENPLEKFAWAYEWYVNRSDEFLKLAKHAADRGDKTWLGDYEFLQKNVFGDALPQPNEGKT